MTEYSIEDELRLNKEETALLIEAADKRIDIANEQANHPSVLEPIAGLIIVANIIGLILFFLSKLPKGKDPNTF